MRTDSTVRMFAGMCMAALLCTQCAVSSSSRQSSTANDEIGTDAIVLPPATAEAGQKLLIIAYYEHKVRIPHKVIFVNYYDNTARKNVVKSATTDDDGLAKVEIPAEPDGGSSIFRMSLSESDLPQAEARRTTKRVTTIDGTSLGGEDMTLLKFDGKAMAPVRGKGGLEYPFLGRTWPSDGQVVRFGRDVLRVAPVPQ